MTKKELVEHLKKLGLKGNVQESKKVLEARLEEATVKAEFRLKEMESLLPEVEVKPIVKGKVIIASPLKTYIGRHPITGEELYK